MDLRRDPILPRLYLVLQKAMGRLNCHIHELVHSGASRDQNADRFSRKHYPNADGSSQLDEADVRSTSFCAKAQGGALDYRAMGRVAS